ncbi:MAG: nucleotide exchange factor GrpE [Planctomycetes bacterium]|nr:nucleotide exchange factor GrpE [Planctomycetota bacterium]
MPEASTPVRPANAAESASAAPGTESTTAPGSAPAAAAPAAAAATVASPAAPATVTLPVAEVDELRKRAAERDEFADAARRARADVLNFHQRMNRDQEASWKFRAEHLLRDLLPALDNFHRALCSPDSFPKGPALDGLLLMEREVFRVLEAHGLKAMESLGQVFDPLKHEAVDLVESDEHAANSVVGEVRKGYLLHDRMLRPAQVRIARPKAKPAAGADPSAAAAPPAPPAAPPAEGGAPA